MTATAAVGRGTQALADDYQARLAAASTPIVQGCPTCTTAWFPPRLRCACGGRALEWWPAGEHGRLVAAIRTHTTGTHRHRPPARLRDQVPFDTAIVEPVDWPGIRLAILLRSSPGRPAHVGDLVLLQVHAVGGRPTPTATPHDTLEG